MENILINTYQNQYENIKENKKKISESKKGSSAPNKNKLCWNNGEVHKYSIECPGKEWILGRIKHINNKKIEG